MNKFKPCRRCYNSKIEGYIESEIEGEIVVQECNCHVKWRKTQMLLILLDKANIPSDFNLRFENYKGSYSLQEIQKLQRFVSNFKLSDRSSSLYFYGDNGTQKTTVAYMVALQFLKQDLSVFYIPTMEQIINNFGSFENQRTDKIKQFIQKATESDLVIIDECFANKKAYSVSDYQLNQLRSYLKNRLEVDRKSIILISNTKITDIENQGYSKTIQSLIIRNTLNGKVLTFKDYYDISNTEFELDDIFN